MTWQFKEESGQTSQSNGDWQFKPEAEPSFSPKRAFGGGLKEAIVGGLSSIESALGGGEGSIMGAKKQAQNLIDKAKYESKDQELSEQGLSEEERQQQMGRSPEVAPEASEFLSKSMPQLEPQTPAERIIQKGFKTAGEFGTLETLFPGGSSLMKFLKTLGTGTLFGTGEQIAAEQGEGAAGQIATGTLFALSPFLLRKGKAGVEKAIKYGKTFLKSDKIPEGMPKFLTESKTPQALADLELSQKDLLNRTAKVSEENLSKFEDIANKVSESKYEGVKDFNASEIENEIVKSNKNALLDTISPAAETQKENWESLQKYVESNFDAAKETYGKLYDIVETEAKNIPVQPKNTFEVASSIYEDLSQSLINASGESGVKSALTEVVSLLKPMARGELVEIPTSRLLATKRSINRLLKKSDIIPAPVDLLKPVGKAIKKDISAALSEKTNLGTVFNAAENQFAETQNIFNNDAVKKLRKTQSAEDMMNVFSKPSNLEKLQAAIGEDKKVQSFLDRLVVDNISSKGKDLAREMKNETQQFLNADSRKVLDKILDYGDSLTSKGQQSVARSNILKDIQQSFDTGSRPDYTLKLMNNKIGHNLVKDVLGRSPKGKKMLSSLKRMALEDIISSTIGKNKQIDFEKAKDIFKNPEVETLIKDTVGEEGLKFFKNLENYGSNMSNNLMKLSVKNQSMFSKILEKYMNSKMKYLFYVVAPKTAVGAVVGEFALKRAKRVNLYKILENKQARSTIKELGQKNLTPEKTSKLFKDLSKIVGSVDMNEE